MARTISNGCNADDGVFAIAITMLAIELHRRTWDHTMAGCSARGAELIAYAVTFVVIAIYWASHRRSFKRFLRADGWLTVLNLLTLGFVVLLPPATALLFEGERGGGAMVPAAAAVYVGLIACIGFSSAATWGYAALVGKLIDPKTPWALRWGVFLIQLLVPVTMVALNFYAATNRSLWPLGVAVVLMTGAILFRRHLNRLEKRQA